MAPNRFSHKPGNDVYNPLSEVFCKETSGAMMKKRDLVPPVELRHGHPCGTALMSYLCSIFTILDLS